MAKTKLRIKELLAEKGMTQAELADKLGSQDGQSQMKAIDYTLLQIERNRVNLEKGEIDLSGNIESISYSDIQSPGKQAESLFGKLFR